MPDDKKLINVSHDKKQVVIIPLGNGLGTSSGKKDLEASSFDEEYLDTKNEKGVESADPPVAGPTYPEGGRQAWMTVAGAWLVQFCTFGFINSFGVFNDLYVREYLTNKTSSDIGWIGSVQVFLVLSSGVVTGQLFDKGYFHHLMIGGSILYGVSMFLLSFTKEGQFLQVFLAHGLGIGLACGLTYVPSLGIVSHYFNRKRPVAMGIVASGSSLGAVIHPIMLNKLFHGAPAFHNGVRISTLFNFGLLVLANLLMRTRLPPRTGPPVKIGHFARDLPYVVVVFSAFMMLLGVFFPIFYLQLTAILHGVDADLAFYSLAVLNAASFVGRLVPAALVPRLGVFNIMVVCATLCSTLIFCLLLVTNVASTMIFAIAFGFFSGAVITLLAPMLASLAQNQNEIGARMGICFAFTGVAGLFGTPITGALLTSQYTWWRPTVFAGVVTLVSSVFLIVTRFLVAARKGSQTV